MKIALDVMGGDFGADPNIKGLRLALQDFHDVEQYVLVGDEAAVKACLQANGLPATDARYSFVHTTQVVEMSDHSAAALRAKKNSSISVAADLLKQGAVDAIVSAGHTGAAVASTVVKNRLLAGIERPCLATAFPALDHPFVILDVGANVDAKPLHLAHYGIMGEAYARIVLGIDQPRVGLLSVGAEDGKGNELTRAAAGMLKRLPINFIGNIEGRDFFDNRVDVVVCDGFVGNAMLKTCEGLARCITRGLKQCLKKNPLRMTGAFLAQGAFHELKELFDHEGYGGAPLLGINGICIIAHGASSPWAIRNALRVAREMVQQQINQRIAAKLLQVDWSALAIPTAE